MCVRARAHFSSSSVQMFFRNDTTVPPYPLQLPGCALDCPLEDFVRITKPSISDDRDKECQLPSDGRDKGKPSPHTHSLKTLQKPASVSRMHDGICGPFLIFLFLSILLLVEVVISLVVSGCVLFLLIVVLLGIICWQNEPIGSQGYRHVINQEDRAES